MREHLDRTIFHLNWMIQDLDFRNSQTGINQEDSEELKDAKELLNQLKEEQESAGCQKNTNI